MANYCDVYKFLSFLFLRGVQPLKGKRTEIGRIGSKHAKVSQESSEETFDSARKNSLRPEVDKRTSVTMNGPVSDDMDNVNTKEGMLSCDL